MESEGLFPYSQIPSSLLCFLSENGLDQRPTAPFIKTIPNFFVNLLKPTGYVKHQQFNIQQLYALPTLYLRVLYLSENKQRLVPLTA